MSSKYNISADKDSKRAYILYIKHIQLVRRNETRCVRGAGETWTTLQEDFFVFLQSYRVHVLLDDAGRHSAVGRAL